METEIHKVPSCFPTPGCVCLDDCMVSCAYWEDCLDYEEEEEDLDE